MCAVRDQSEPTVTSLQSSLAKPLRLGQKLPEMSDWVLSGSNWPAMGQIQIAVHFGSTSRNLVWKKNRGFVPFESKFESLTDVINRGRGRQRAWHKGAWQTDVQTETLSCRRCTSLRAEIPLKPDWSLRAAACSSRSLGSSWWPWAKVSRGHGKNTRQFIE